MRGSLGLVAMLAILPIVSMAGCIGEAAGPTGNDSTQSAGVLVEAVVTRGVLQHRVLLTGELEAIDPERILVPKTPNPRMPIRWLEADGTAVIRGQTVLELDNTQFTTDLQERRLTEARALNQLMRKEADISVELADGEFAVERARVTKEKAALEAAVPASLRPRREYQEKQLELARAEVALNQAREDLHASQEASESALDELRIGLERARNEVRIAEEAIEALILKAPSSGILVIAENRQERRKFQIGDNVWIGLPVMEIPDLSSMKVVALLSDVDDGRIEVGMAARCSLDAYPDDDYSGRVVDISPIAQEQGRDSMRRAFRVVIHLDRSNPETMRPGMSVKVEVRPEPETSALLVPRAALDFSGASPRARLPNGKLAEVSLGECDTTWCLVESGLVEGTRVEIGG